jgi:hypothetical protein
MLALAHLYSSVYIFILHCHGTVCWGSVPGHHFWTHRKKIPGEQARSSSPRTATRADTDKSPPHKVPMLCHVGRDWQGD